MIDNVEYNSKVITERAIAFLKTEHIVRQVPGASEYRTKLEEVLTSQPVRKRIGIVIIDHILRAPMLSLSLSCAGKGDTSGATCGDTSGATCGDTSGATCAFLGMATNRKKDGDCGVTPDGKKCGVTSALEQMKGIGK